MRRIKLEFTNAEGMKLAARLDLPVGEEMEVLAIFAHCFTCTKNLTAIRNISQALTRNKVGVLLFDFTGLGESEGEFHQTNFSTNISDLVAAFHFLKKQFTTPQILIGHSLGGAAVIRAAAQLPDIKAVVVIGAPADPPHVVQLFKHGLDEIERTGQALVDIGGRPFTITRQFIEDLKEHRLGQVLGELNKALLILHSPQDRTVSIDNAAMIYQAAKHPKSFITLDGADHLLTDQKDSFYVGNMIAHWVDRYITRTPAPKIRPESQVLVRTGSEAYTTEILAGDHSMVADEPVSLGGADLGPTPYDLLLAALGACTGITLRMYANRKRWPLNEISIELEHSKRHAKDSEGCEQPTSKLDHIDKTVHLEGPLDQSQKERLMEIADRCPVHRTLLSDIVIKSKLGP